MAYRFVRTSGTWIEFAGAPLTGYTFGPLTWAIFFKAAETFTREFFSIRGSGDRAWVSNSGGDLYFNSNGGANQATGPTGVLDTTSWMLLVVTCAGTGSTPRFHVHKGTSWAHSNAGGSFGATAIVSGDTLRIATRNPAASTMSLDVVCAGIKKADSSDATVETLTRTAFQDWRNFGFDWLIGFDSSLETGGVLQDQASPGTGDEVSRTASPALVADPAGWAWVSATKVSSTRTLQYAVAGRVSATRTLAYAITSTVASTRTLAWGVGTIRVAATRTLAYGVGSRAASIVRVRYAILEPPFRMAATQTLQWTVVDYDLPPEVEPDGRFLMAFDAAALEHDPEWTRIDDIPNLVTSYTIDRGRQYELDRTDTGRATVSIIDTDGILDPRNPDGPFYGKIMPLVQARLGRRNPVTDEWKTRYRGWVEDLNYQVDPTGRFNRLEITLVDMFEILSAIEMQPGKFGGEAFTGVIIPVADNGQIQFPQAKMNDRIIRVLNQAGVPKPFRVIFSGNVIVQDTTYSAGESPMTVVQDAADAEFPGVANVYCDRKGRFCVHGRLAKFYPELVAAGASVGAWDFQRWKAGDATGIGYYPDATAQLRSFAYNRGLGKVINHATATPQGIEDNQVAFQLVEDTASIARYGIRSWSATNLLTKLSLIDSSSANAETKRFATYYVQNYSQPQDRITDISFRPLRPDDPRAAATWKLMSEIDISDAVAVSVSNVWSEPGEDGFVLEDYFVEGIHEQVQPLDGEIDDVTMTLDLSPAAYFAANPWPGGGGG